MELWIFMRITVSLLSWVNLDISVELGCKITVVRFTEDHGYFIKYRYVVCRYINSALPVQAQIHDRHMVMFLMLFYFL